MSFRKKEFKTQLNEITLGINSRMGGTTVVKIPQIAWDGSQLDKSAVSKQAFIIKSEGKNSVKVKAAYHKDSPLCAYLPNTLSNKTKDREMPLPLILASKVKEVLPQDVEVKNGRVPDFTYVKKDETGKITSAAEFKNGSWVKVDYNVPLYKEYFTNTYEPISEERKEGTDDKGNFIYTFSPYCYIAQCNVGFFVGHTIDKVGKKVNGSEGVYMVEGGFNEKYFSKLYPQKSGGKVSIGNRLNKVFAHPQFGVVQENNIINGKLAKGSFRYDPNSVTIAIYNENGEVAAMLDDRASYKLGKFRPVGVKSVNTEETNQVNAIIEKVEKQAPAINTDDIASLLG